MTEVVMPSLPRVVLSTVTALLVLSLGASPAAAQDYHTPYFEAAMGATNIEATVGNQRLTVGVSAEGDITVLSWPSPSYFDHLHYISSNDRDARQQPRFGAEEGMGAFAGLVVDRDEETELETTFLRDEGWESQLTYADVDVGTIASTYDHDELGLTVHQYDFVPPERDVLVRDVQLERDEDSDVDEAWLLGYANLSPNLSKLEQLPLADVLMDHRTDFMAGWDETEEAIVHFQPEDTGVLTEITEAFFGVDRDFGPLGELLEDEDVDTDQASSIIENLDDHYASGAYATLTTQPAPEQFQIGEDHTDTCGHIDEMADNVEVLPEDYPDGEFPIDPEMIDVVRCSTIGHDPLGTPRSDNDWDYSATDALEDAKSGELSGDPLAGGNVNTALKTPLDFEDDTARAALLVGFGKTRDESFETLNSVRDDDLQQVREVAEADDREFVDDLWIPEEIDGDLREFVIRAFLNLRVGIDDETGAAVASISRQPPYQLDWPRDGAFYNLALDLAGQNELVTKRMEFYSETIRDEVAEADDLLNNPVPGWPDDPDNEDFPPDTWEMNYYADGTVGGPIRLEIDNTALLVWNYVYHVGHLEGDERDDYIDEVWPTVERAADWLAGWRDPETGLNWPANEDDHMEYTQGLQSSGTTFGALVDAARLARHIGEDDKADDWLERAGELRDATFEHHWDDEEGFRGLGDEWLAWPNMLFDDDDPRLHDHIESILDDTLAEVAGETDYGLYPTKIAIPAALQHPDEEVRQGALTIAEAYVEDFADPATWTVGETFMPVDDTGDGEPERFMTAVSPPHLWTMVLVYVSVVAYHHPDQFDPHHEVLPDVEVPGDYEVPDDDDETSDDIGTDDDVGVGDDEDPEGCGGCAVAGGPGGGLVVVVALVVLVGVRRL